MNKKLIIIPFAILVLLMIGAIFYFRSLVPKVAVVRNSYMLENYEGMKEAIGIYDNKKVMWKANLDTLNTDYQRAVSKFNLELPSLSEDEKNDRAHLLERQRSNLQNYQVSLEKAAREEDEKLTQGVLAQLDEFIKDYGEKQGYDIIIGSTDGANVLYMRDALDISEEVLKAANEAYKKGGIHD